VITNIASELRTLDLQDLIMTLIFGVLVPFANILEIYIVLE